MGNTVSSPPPQGLPNWGTGQVIWEVPVSFIPGANFFVDLIEQTFLKMKNPSNMFLNGDNAEQSNEMK